MRVGQLLTSTASWRRPSLPRNCSSLGAVAAHEGHDHDKPAPLNLPVAPRVVAVTPDYELVGVAFRRAASDDIPAPFRDRRARQERQDLGLCRRAEVEAVAKEDGVFEVTAAWLRSAASNRSHLQAGAPRRSGHPHRASRESERWEFGRRTGAFKRACQLPDPPCRYWRD